MRVVRTLLALPGGRRCLSTTAAFAGQTKEQLQNFHGLLRKAQVAEALRGAYQEGSCTAKEKGLQELSRATRTRPSLLAPVASALGMFLRCVPALPASAGMGNVQQGLVASMEETLDANVRKLVEMERPLSTPSKAPVVELKEYMKKRRDGLGFGENGASQSGVLTQATQVVCRALLQGAERF